MRRLLTLLAATALSLAPAAASSQAASFCQAGQSPAFAFGFQALSDQLGAAMGQPVECEHANPTNGDTLQQTTTGLSFYRKSTNTPTFTDGTNHWGLTAGGLVYWTGSSIDPPDTTTTDSTAPSAAPPVAATPTPSPAPVAPAQPVPAATSTPVAPPAASTTASTCGAPSNPWGYTFCGGSPVTVPPANFCSVFTCIQSFWDSTNGYVVQCQDGMFSHAGGRQGACSRNGGPARTLYSP
jgi:hypothetical protein